jgi:hypothetical protein
MTNFSLPALTHPVANGGRFQPSAVATDLSTVRRRAAPLRTTGRLQVETPFHRKPFKEMFLMKRFLCILLTLSALAAATVGVSPTAAQQPDADPSAPQPAANPQDHFANPRSRRPDIEQMHAALRRGATPEAKAAWDKLTPAQRAQIKDKIDKAISEAKAKHEREKAEKRAAKAEVKNWKDILKGKATDTVPDSPLYFTDKHGGNGRLMHAKEREAAAEPAGNISAQMASGDISAQMICMECEPPDPDPYPTPNPTPNPTPPPSGTDADFDGLPESLENSVADAFTPFYHVSAGEPDNYATFADSPSQMVQQSVGKTPFSYFRVQPLGFAYNYQNQLVSVLRIDYLTLWDHDSGLVVGGACSLFPPLSGLAGSYNHPIDNERSAVLVAAPVYSYNYNLNPSAYSAYSYYTAAHEDTFFDHSMYADFPTNPIPAGLHIHFAQSLSKHATYTFNPDGMTLVPDYVVAGVFTAVDYYCYQSIFDYDFGWNDIGCIAALYYAYGAINECAIERFFDQGGQYAQGRVNVGEPNNPINGSNFIRDDTYGLNSKLVNPVF